MGGELPTCLPSIQYDNYAEDDYDEDDYEPIDDGTTSESQVAENPAENPMAPPPPPPPNTNEVPLVDTVYREDIDQPALKTELEKGETVVETMAQPALETEVQPVLDTDVQPEVEIEVQPVVETMEQPVVETKIQPEVEETVVQPLDNAEPDPSVDLQAVIEPVVVVPVEPDTNQNQTQVATDISIVVAPTEDPYTPRLLDENCGEDQGGCAHKCQRLLFPGENEPRLSCSCNKGYTLDPTDESSCLGSSFNVQLTEYRVMPLILFFLADIDECQESNGGCSQICNNFPGSFECACEKGYQIDVLTGNTCIGEYIF